MTRKWKDIKRKFVKVEPRYPHLTEANAAKAGETAFNIRVPYYNNPYTDPICKNGWIRGFKRAERTFNEALRFSVKVQSTIPLEEVEV